MALDTAQLSCSSVSGKHGGKIGRSILKPLQELNMFLSSKFPCFLTSDYYGTNSLSFAAEISYFRSTEPHSDSLFPSAEGRYNRPITAPFSDDLLFSSSIPRQPQTQMNGKTTGDMHRSIDFCWSPTSMTSHSCAWSK